MPKLFCGIDFGTSNSSVAISDGRQVRVLEVDPENDTPTSLPSLLYMARDAGLPVVPLAVRGLYEVNHKGSWLFRPGDITVYVGPQIETEGMSNQEVEAVADRLHRVLSAFVDDGTIVSGEALQARAL